jgi:hypothetical protein
MHRMQRYNIILKYNFTILFFWQFHTKVILNCFKYSHCGCELILFLALLNKYR